MKAFRLAMILGAAATFATPALASTEYPTDATSPSFKQIDANGDGSISRDEFDKGLESMFKAYDWNKDGVLTTAEVAIVNKTWFKPEGADDELPWVDDNRDNVMDMKEFNEAMNKRFDALDTNHDKMLSSAEYTPEADYQAKIEQQVLSERAALTAGKNGDQSSMN